MLNFYFYIFLKENAKTQLCREKKTLNFHVQHFHTIIIRFRVIHEQLKLQGINTKNRPINWSC